MEKERAIVHMDLDTFFVSCERLADRRLQGKPVLIGGSSDRGVVAACSYETRQFGVHSGMPMRMARQLCPEAIVLRGNTGTYTQYSQAVTNIIKEEVPLYEKSSIDEFYIDLTGTDRFFGTYKIASELRSRIINETGLPISFGLASNKTVSKIATGEAKPNNQLRIASGHEKPFLAPLSVKKIPMVGPKTFQALCDFGMKRIATVQQIPATVMQNVFGKNGLSIWKKANGIDNSPVEPYVERKSVSTERTFDKDTTDVHKLRNLVVAMAEQLVFELRKANKLTSNVSVKIRYSDFKTYTLQQSVAYSASDHALIPVVVNLYNRLYNRRLLVRLVGVKFNHLVAGGHQINLFEDTGELMNLYAEMDKMRLKYGAKAVIRASGLGVSSRHYFNPFTGSETT